MDASGRTDWIVGICSVVFDLDIGQQLESVFPADALPEPTASAVAFHALPVSTTYTFLYSGCPPQTPRILITIKSQCYWCANIRAAADTIIDVAGVGFNVT